MDNLGFHYYANLISMYLCGQPVLFYI